MSDTNQIVVPRCRFRIGQRVRVVNEKFASEWPGVVTITGIDWNPARDGSLNISIMTDEEIARRCASTDGWREDDLQAVDPTYPSGIVIESLDGNCPVQGEGSADGVPFYFRARGQRWSLSLGSVVPISNPVWYWEEAYGDGPYDAGWMSEEEAVRFIHAGIARWRTGDPGKPVVDA